MALRVRALKAFMMEEINWCWFGWLEEIEELCKHRMQHRHRSLGEMNDATHFHFFFGGRGDVPWCVVELLVFSRCFWHFGDFELEQKNLPRAVYGTFRIPLTPTFTYVF